LTPLLRTALIRPALIGTALIWAALIWAALIWAALIWAALAGPAGLGPPLRAGPRLLAAPVTGVRAHWAVRPRRLSRPGLPAGAAGLPGAGLRLFALAGTGHRVGPEAGRQPGDRLRHVRVVGDPGPGPVVAGPGPVLRPVVRPPAARILVVIWFILLSRPARPTRGHFVLPRFLVLSVTPPQPALPTTASLGPGRPRRARARVGPAPEPGTARSRSRLLSVTRPGAGGLPPGPLLVPRAPPPEPRTTRRLLLRSRRAIRPALGLVILAVTPPQTGRGRTRRTGGNRTGGRLPRPRRAAWLRVGLPAPRTAAAGRCTLLSSGRDVVVAGLGWVRRPGYQPVPWLATVADWRAGLGWRGSGHGRIGCRLAAWLAAVVHRRAGLGWRGGRFGCRLVARLAAVAYRCAGLGGRPGRVRPAGYQPVAWFAAAPRCAGLAGAGRRRACRVTSGARGVLGG
jgi:hypothetical protein